MLLSHDISTWFSVQLIVQLSYIHIFHPLIVHSFTAFVQSKFHQLYEHRYQFVVQFTTGTVISISLDVHVFAEKVSNVAQFLLIVRTQSFIFQLNASSCPFVAKRPSRRGVIIQKYQNACPSASITGSVRSRSCPKPTASRL